MTPKTSSGHPQHIIVGLVVLVCFTALFFMYYKPAISWLPCPRTEPTPDTCKHVCLDVPKMEKAAQLGNNCTLNYTMVQQQTADTQSPVLESAQNTKVVLIWSWPFGHHFNLDSCGSELGITGCRLTDDRSQLDKAHGVMFHLRDIGGDLSYLLTLSRPPLQKWVWMNMESPANSPQLPGADHLFNLTSNYRRDSDIWVPYGRLIEASEEDKKTFQIPTKDKLVCWIVSNWNVNYKRVGYFNELSKYINVEGYGRHFDKYIDQDDYAKVMSSCKFYLSFENSIYKDYMTEKLFNALKYGTVPVVIGPPRVNYEEYIPGDSFIHIDDFGSPQELAEHLKLLDQNQEMYEQYFAWRKYFTVKESPFGLEHACRICEYLNKNHNFRVFTNINQWYWS
ncbi:4-galactosyl-N-acetylglucosaminide 3-alpha-L-fucosyltransferase 9-like [Brachyhypopomus gauderio]|uniref:4-galactosyl-N-acetylglucosaminide 3-alpha-L-fucosyltransferase 9-like n=1 Tax=Brachyhypopomus gauderio TaxID=698409 RepID=UPI0040413054